MDHMHCNYGANLYIYGANPYLIIVQCGSQNRS